MYHKLAFLVALLFLCLTCSSKSEEAKDKPTTEGKTSITIVYDNYQISPELKTAWGFGCVINTPDIDILFDTGGDSNTLLSNMEKMNINPVDIDIVIISHIHGDHIGGLEGFLKKNSNVKVYIPASFPDSIKGSIISLGAEYVVISEAGEICRDIYTTGEMGETIKEQSLILNTEKGIVVITGCAHPGIVEIVKRAKEIVPGRNIYLVMGGFHLGSASDRKLKGIIESFRELGVEKVAPSHCSGNRCRELFKEEYKSDYIDSGAGKKINI